MENITKPYNCNMKPDFFMDIIAYDGNKLFKFSSESKKYIK